MHHLWGRRVDTISSSSVVVCLPRPMEGMGRLQFSDLFTELSVPPQAAGVVGTININN